MNFIYIYFVMYVILYQVMVIYLYILFNYIVINDIVGLLQVVYFLQVRKSSFDDIVDITVICFKLNFFQLRELLQRYIFEFDEFLVFQ